MRIKRFLSVLLSMLMVCSIFGGLSVSAHSSYDSDDHTYTAIGNVVNSRAFSTGITHYVTGESGLCNGVNWDPKAEENMMTKNSDGSYEITFKNVHPKEDGTAYEFKVVTNGGWEPAYNYNGVAVGEDSNAKIFITEPNSTVKIVLTTDLKVRAYVNSVDVSPKPTISTTKQLETTDNKGSTSAVTNLGGIYTGPTTGGSSTRFFFAMPADWYTFNNATACAYWWNGTDSCTDWQHSYQMRSTPLETVNGTRVYYIDAPSDVGTIIFNNGIYGGTKAAEGEEPSPNWGKNFKTVNVNLEGYYTGENKVYPKGIKSFDNMIYVVDERKVYEDEYTSAKTFGGEWYYLHADGMWDSTPGTTYEIKDVNVVLDKREANVDIGNTLQLKPTFINKTYDAYVEWSSSNEKVATVDQNGKVTGKSNGTAIISLTVQNPGDSEYLVVTCTVTVKQPVTNIKLNVTDKNIYTGDTFTLKATAYPSNASNKKISFTSDNTKIATVTPSGLVKGIKPGTTTITAESTDGGYIFAICKVVVKEKAIANKIVVASSFNKYFDEKSFNLGAKAKTKLNYKSSNKKVVTVSSNGKVTIKGIGKATITLSAVATSKYKSAIKKVTVNIKLKPINSKSVKIQKINNSTVKLSWSKVNSVNGYSVKIVSSASGRKNTAEAVLKKTSVKLVNVQKGQKLEISIRTYKKVGNKNYYSSWIKKTLQ